jgi:hypothetical protein
MAKLNHTELFTLDRAAWHNRGGRIIVGNNRTLEYTAGGDLVFRLHGSVIAQMFIKNERRRVLLDTCGYLTTTTISAMNDFLNAIGSNCRASRAKGHFTVRTSDGGSIGGGPFTSFDFDA